MPTITSPKADGNSPLKQAVFRRFYVGMAATSFGYAMLSTSGAWLMATLSPSPLMVALVQSASTLPSLLLGLIAGALADSSDRRRLLILSHLLLVISAMTLAVATYVSIIGPMSLLFFLFLTGTGFTFSLPAQQAMVGDLVAHKDLTAAVSLTAIAMNVSRAAAPALAGGIATIFGTGSVFLTSAVFLGIMILSVSTVGTVLRKDEKLREGLLPGIRSGLRYMRHSRPTLACIAHNFIFCLFGSAILALLPLIARDQLGLGAGGYGLLLGSFGTGAVAGSLIVGRSIFSLTANEKINYGMAIFGFSIAMVGNSTNIGIVLIAAALSGVTWVSVMGYLFSGALSWSPAWVRARIISANLLVIQAGLAIGSALWGWLASTTSSGISLTVSGLCLIVALAILRKIHVTHGTEDDVTTMVSTPEISFSFEPHLNDGPVLIQTEYRISKENLQVFLQDMLALETVRRRNGAEEWGIYRDVEEDDCYYERFIVASWGDYTRLQRRSTVFDQNLEIRINTLQQPGIPIRTSHLISLQNATRVE